MTEQVTYDEEQVIYQGVPTIISNAALKYGPEVPPASPKALKYGLNTLQFHHNALDTTREFYDTMLKNKKVAKADHTAMMYLMDHIEHCLGYVEERLCDRAQETLDKQSGVNSDDH